jgi:hypothetical protein
VADLDGDGTSEVLVAENGVGGVDMHGLTVYGHAGGGWAGSGSTWPSHDYVAANIGDAGAVATTPGAFWLDPMLYRGRAPVAAGAADLSVSIVDACAAACNFDAPVRVAAEVSNSGTRDAGARVDISLYRVDGGTETWLATTSLDALASGATAGVAFEVSTDDLGSDGLLVRVDDDGSGSGAHGECDETNNTAVTAATCEGL